MQMFPSETDSPENVQHHLFELLTSVHNLDQEHARLVANEWTIGTGAELYRLPAQAFVDIFGAQIGWVLFQEVKRKGSRKGKYEDDRALLEAIKKLCVEGEYRFR